MPSFDPAADFSQSQDWYLIRDSPVHLFWQTAMINQTVEWLRSHGYRIFSFDAAGWDTETDMHKDLAQGFGFPDQPYPNYDGLNDHLTDVALYQLCADATSAGTVMVISRFNVFVAQCGVFRSHILLDIFANAARMAMLVGHRMLCLLQSDDPDLAIGPVGASPVRWNVKESLLSVRHPE